MNRMGFAPEQVPAERDCYSATHRWAPEHSLETEHLYGRYFDFPPPDAYNGTSHRRDIDKALLADSPWRHPYAVQDPYLLEQYAAFDGKLPGQIDLMIRDSTCFAYRSLFYVWADELKFGYVKGQSGLFTEYYQHTQRYDYPREGQFSSRRTRDLGSRTLRSVSESGPGG